MLNYNPVAGSLAQARGSSAAGTPWRILILSVVVFACVLVVYLGMDFGYRPYLEGRIADADAQMDSLTRSLDDQKQQNLFGLYSQLYNIQQLASDRTFISPVFSLIEGATHPQVTLTAVRFDEAQHIIEADARAADYDLISNQLSAFKRNAAVESAILVSSKTVDSAEVKGVEFSIRMQMDEKFFGEAVK